MKIPTVVIVGRPNVGKSTLFNLLAGERKAITSNIPGTTRDRLYANIEWNKCQFRLVDTAGLFFDPHKEISTDILDQIEVAVSEADLLLFVVDNQTGLLPADKEVAHLLKKKKKPTILLANKTDTSYWEQQVYEFYKLGFGEPMPISSLSGRRSGDLLDKIIETIPKSIAPLSVSENTTTIAIVGRPNVGKSTFLNTLLGDKRVSVSNVPGTTRDAIDADLVVNSEKYILIDTAGIRRKGKVAKGIEKYSVMRALSAIERSQIVIILIDATAGMVHQDKILLHEALEASKGILLLVNKWDLAILDAAEKGIVNEEYFKDFENILKIELKFAPWIPVLTISALTSKRVQKIWKEIREIKENLKMVIGQSNLSKRLLYWKREAPMPSSKGQSLRIFGVKQTGVNPPKFTFRVNQPKLAHFSYQRFLENKLRSDFKINKIPIILEFKKADFG